jgi:drug/metabolite transporter (DMT)-like permease
MNMADIVTIVAAAIVVLTGIGLDRYLRRIRTSLRTRLVAQLPGALLLLFTLGVRLSSDPVWVALLLVAGLFWVLMMFNPSRAVRRLETPERK